MSEDRAFLTIAEAGRRIRAGSVSPVDLVSTCLSRIRSQDPYLRSLLHVDQEGAVAAARLAEAEIGSGLDRGPMHGIPVGIKDLFDVEAMPTTLNSALPHAPRAAQDAEVVRRLRAGGAILIGKLAAWECGVGGTSVGLPWPPARNPWALERDPGGSSSGAGAAVAAGLCFGAVGSDTGGSIREPASWCGIAGLKPTYGLVPGQGGLAASFSLDHIGPMARTSADCAAMLDAMTGGGTAVHGLDRGVAGLRIGIVDLSGEEGLGVEPAVSTALDRSAAALDSAGAHLSAVRLPPLDLFGAVVTVLAGADGYALHRRRLQDVAGLYDPLTRQRLLAGARVSAADYVDAMCVRRRLIAGMAGLWAGHDLLLMPATRSPAPPLGGFDSHGGHPSLNRPWNVTGSPALSVRSGFAGGLPLAVQIVGRPFEDALVLRAGHALEALLGVSSLRPPDHDAAAAAPAIAALPDDEAIERLAVLIEEAAARLRGGATGEWRPASEFRLPLD